jgi:hypothetical protein
MNHEETRRALELNRYFVVQPAFKNIYRNIDYRYSDILNKTVTNPYNSNNEAPIHKDRLSNFLYDNKLLEEDPTEWQHPAERHWPNGEN